jgi:hypothetical protein
VCVQSKVQWPWVIRIPSEPRSRSERNELPCRSARPHVPLLTCFPFLFRSFRFFLLSRALIIASCSTTKTALKLATQDDPLVPITVPPAFTTPSLHSSLHFYPLVSRSRTTLTDTKPLSCASRMLLHLSHFSVSFFLCTYIYSIQSPSPAPPRSPLLYNIELADKAARMHIR